MSAVWHPARRLGTTVQDVQTMEQCPYHLRTLDLRMTWDFSTSGIFTHNCADHADSRVIAVAQLMDSAACAVNFTFNFFLWLRHCGRGDRAGFIVSIRGCSFLCL